MLLGEASSHQEVVQWRLRAFDMVPSWPGVRWARWSASRRLQSAVPALRAHRQGAVRDRSAASPASGTGTVRRRADVARGRADRQPDVHADRRRRKRGFASGYAQPGDDTDQRPHDRLPARRRSRGHRLHAQPHRDHADRRQLQGICDWDFRQRADDADRPDSARLLLARGRRGDPRRGRLDRQLRHLDRPGDQRSGGLRRPVDDVGPRHRHRTRPR